MAGLETMETTGLETTGFVTIGTVTVTIEYWNVEQGTDCKYLISRQNCINRLLRLTTYTSKSNQKSCHLDMILARRSSNASYN